MKNRSKLLKTNIQLYLIEVKNWKENKELKNQIKQMQTQENQFHQKQFYQNQFDRKRPLSRFDYENNDDEDIQYIIRKTRKNPVNNFFCR